MNSPAANQPCGLPMLRCFTHARYFADLPQGHVFPMTKFPTSAQAIHDSRIGRLIDPGLIDERDLFRAHTPEYVASIRTGAYNDLTRQRLGLPWHPTIATRSFSATSGTLCAARAAVEDGLAANLAGGTHHAFADRGEGFCVFNDVAVAIRALHAEEPLLQCMVVDLDAHQGNGTNHLFRDDRRVFTYDVHVGRNYPSRKEPSSLDVALNRFAGADEYFSRLTRTLPDALERFEPDLVFYNSGVDVHHDDRFGQMRLSTQDIAHRDRWTIDLCRDWGIPVCVVYGGGYNAVEGMTAALHVQTIRVASERFAREQAPRRPISLPSPRLAR
jgi:acetoin utilization deacetylase AcuC-like enzyme